MATQQQRQQRVREGSRRRRDLAAVGGLMDQESRHSALAASSAAAQAEREQRLRPRISADAEAVRAWPWVLNALSDRYPVPTFKIWLEPMACIGSVDGAMAVEAPGHIFAWLNRRYGKRLGDAVRETTGYRGAFLFLAAPPDDRGDGCL